MDNFVPALSKLDREQFIGWLGNSYEPESKSSLSQETVKLKEGDILIIRDRSRAAKDGSIILVNDNELEGFLAFTSTYISTYSPFTAFFHVAPISMLYLLYSMLTKERVQSLPARLVGVAIAEASMDSAADISIEHISLLTCNSTLSMCVLNSANQGYTSDAIGPLSLNWTRALNMLSRNPARARSIETFWLIVARSLDGHPVSFVGDSLDTSEIQQFIARYVSSKEINANDWKRLTQSLPDIPSIDKVAQGSREDQVRLIDRLIQILGAADHIDLTIRELVAGALIATLAQGSFKYLPFALSLDQSLPSTALWFAFFASLQRSSDVYSIGDCLGRKLSRQMVSVPCPLQQNDISLDELEVITSGTRRAFRHRTSVPNVIRISLLPGVDVQLARSRADTTSPARTDTAALREIRHLLMQAERLTESLERSSTSDQTELFNSSTSKSKYVRNRKDRN